MTEDPGSSEPGVLIGAHSSADRANLSEVTRQFDRAIRLMRRHDPQAQEDGFGALLPCAAEHVDELIAAFDAERDDHGLRC